MVSFTKFTFANIAMLFLLIGFMNQSHFQLSIINNIINFFEHLLGGIPSHPPQVPPIPQSTILSTTSSTSTSSTSTSTTIEYLGPCGVITLYSGQSTKCGNFEIVLKYVGIAIAAEAYPVNPSISYGPTFDVYYHIYGVDVNVATNISAAVNEAIPVNYSGKSLSILVTGAKAGYNGGSWASVQLSTMLMNNTNMPPPPKNTNMPPPPKNYATASSSGYSSASTYLKNYSNYICGGASVTLKSTNWITDVGFGNISSIGRSNSSCSIKDGSNDGAVVTIGTNSRNFSIYTQNSPQMSSFHYYVSSKSNSESVIVIAGLQHAPWPGVDYGSISYLGIETSASCDEVAGAGTYTDDSSTNYPYGVSTVLVCSSSLPYDINLNFTTSNLYKASIAVYTFMS